MANSDEYGDWTPGGATQEEDDQDALRRQALLDQMQTPTGGNSKVPKDLPGPVITPTTPDPPTNTDPPIDVHNTPPIWKDFPGGTTTAPNDPGQTIDGPGGGPAPDPQSPNVPAPNAPAPTPQPATTTPVQGEGRARAAAYFASKGVTPFPTSLDSWENFWQQWGAKDPSYFDQRLAQADEFTGVGPNYD